MRSLTLWSVVAGGIERSPACRRHRVHPRENENQPGGTFPCKWNAKSWTVPMLVGTSPFRKHGDESPDERISNLL